MTAECDEWEGNINSAGYGTLYVAITSDNKSGCLNAHRLVWMQDNGPIPDGMVIMHTCDNRLCVNVEHLRLGTQQDNMVDKVVKGRSGVPPRGERCRHGHLWSEETIYVHPNGQWHCKPCRRACDVRRRAKAA